MCIYIGATVITTLNLRDANFIFFGKLMFFFFSGLCDIDLRMLSKYDIKSYVSCEVISSRFSIL